MSKYLSRPALRALNRIGDIMIPAYESYPSFSQGGGLDYVDDFIAYAPADDLKDLNMALTVFGFFPGFALRWLVHKFETSAHNNGPLGSIFRMLDTGLRGIIFACYYSGRMGHNYQGPNPLDLMEYELVRVVD